MRQYVIMPGDWPPISVFWGSVVLGLRPLVSVFPLVHIRLVVRTDIVAQHGVLGQVR